MKRVLILDANQRSALAVTRSLGKKGVPVFTAEESSSALAGASRYSQQHFEYPSPRQSPNKFVDALKRLVQQQVIEIIMPMTELTTELLLSNKSSFRGVAIPSSELATVNSLANKYALMRMADKLGVPTPISWYVDSPNTLPINLEELIYPLVLKPGKSWLLHHGKWDRAAVRFAQNPASAQIIMKEEIAFQIHPFILQESVPGHGSGVFAIYDHGKPLAFFAHNRLREKPPSGGVSVLSESTSVNPALLEHTRTLLNKVNWHGAAMVEFRITPDGKPYLMEINTRLWGSLQLAIDAGVDFPWMLYQLACGKQPERVTNYKTGIRLRWLLGDIDNLYLTLKNSQYSYSRKLSALRQFLTPSPFRTKHEVNRWCDLGPAWYEIKQYLRDLLK